MPIKEPPLSTDEERYSRQVLFAGIGKAGQMRLQGGHVALVGCGGTGAAAAGLLARAGVGRLTVIDRDFVEPSNLQRQMLFTEEDAATARPKAEAAKLRIRELNRETEVVAHVADLVPANVHDLLNEADILLDATDNFETRYLLNDFAVFTAKPWIYSAAVGSYAAGMNVLPDHQSACLACIFPEPPGGTVETCETAGVLNSAVNLAASIQVTEAIKFLVGDVGSMRQTLWSMDLWTGVSSEVRSSTFRKDCEVCVKRDFRHLRGAARPHITLCGRNSVQIHEHNRPVNFEELEQRLIPHGTVRFNSMLLRFQYQDYQFSVFADGRTVVQGTSDPVRARTLYARFIGS